MNIVNFIRGSEPREPGLDLVQPVREQIRLMQQHQLPGTFLLQYNAMEREDIVSLLRELDESRFELGIWLEMCESHVQAAGLPWRGRPGFDWDWHAQCGFSVGYTPREREKLIDAAFEKFRQVFGREAHVIGSWMIDAHSLAYLDQHYAIDASCNCKDQWGTDGYTLWGGYWNQGYYPSRQNAFAPAQTGEGGISFPVFRMLGSDPTVQYDMGLHVESGAPSRQQVASLEPVYPESGGSGEWVRWFMEQNFSSRALGFSYAQAGQENSFGWPDMEKGLTMQLSLFAQWQKEGRLLVEPLGATGRWFRQVYPLTPPTSVCALKPYGQRQAQSVWFNCRNYRMNLYGDATGIRIRDLFCFDQAYPERYRTSLCLTDYLVYDNLPLIDGNRMSGGGILAGGWMADETGAILPPARMDTIPVDDQALRIIWPGQEILLTEQEMVFRGPNCVLLRWMESQAKLTGWDEAALHFAHNGWEYALTVSGSIRQTPAGLLLSPRDGQMRWTLRRKTPSR